MWTRLACWIHRIAANKLEQSGIRIWMPTPLQWRLVGGAMGGWAHCNGWNGNNGTHMWFSYVWYHSIHFIPAITMSPSSYRSSPQPPVLFNVDPTFIPLWSTFFWCCVWIWACDRPLCFIEKLLPISPKMWMQVQRSGQLWAFNKLFWQLTFKTLYVGVSVILAVTCMHLW